MHIRIGDLVGKGYTADVFDIGNNKVVKLFHAGYPPSSVIKEFENSRLLNQLDIPIAKSYKIIIHDERHGIIYDKINGISLLDIVLQTYDIEKYATILACTHKRILRENLPSAISIKTILRKNIEHTDSLGRQSKSKLFEILDTLPDSDNFCHGDFHFGNILMTQQEVYIIDFMNVCKGHRNFDIARTIYLTEITPVPTDMPNKELILEFKKRAADIYLNEMGISRECLSDWLTVIVAARLSELSSEQEIEKSTIMRYLSLQGLRA